MFHRKKYTLRSIIYHEGNDEVVNGHHVCHCLITCKDKGSKRSNEEEKTFGQWFKMDDRCVTPISVEVAVNSSEVKKGFTILIYEQREDVLATSRIVHSKWEKSSCHLPPSTQDIGQNCFFNVFVQSLAFCDLHVEVQSYVGSSYCNEPSKDDITTDRLVSKYNSTIVSKFPTRFHKDFVIPADDSYDKALIRFDKNNDQAENSSLMRSLFNHPCQLYHDYEYYQNHFNLETRIRIYEEFDVFSKITLEYPKLLKMEGQLGYFVRSSY